MTDPAEQQPNTQQTNCGSEPVQSNDREVGEKSSVETKKRVYTKPVLRKFSQIDYVTAYGID